MTEELIDDERYEEFWCNGYALIPGVFRPDEIAAFRRGAYAARDHAGDLLSCPALQDFVLDRRILGAAARLLGAPPVYVGDSTCQFEGASGFHKDNPDRHDASGPDWACAERYGVVRFGLYLQDHAEHSGGVGFRRGSHGHPERHKGRSVTVASRPGDLVVWTLRTTHRGAVDHLRWPRLLIGRKLASMLPSAVKLPRPEGDRIALFCSYGADGPDLDRFVEYLLHRTWALERWRSTVYDGETRARIARAGLIVRDCRDRALAQDISAATYKHAPLPR